jgi:type VI secretion system secreted protein Hcp
MRRMLGSAVLSIALVPGLAALANDRDEGRGGPALFVRVDGIDGESTQKGHEGEIEVFNFSETFRQSITTGGGGGGGAGKFTPGPVVFNKLQGRASIGLLRACAKGQHIPTVVITAFRQGGDGKGSPFYKITLKDVFVSAIAEKSTGDAIVDEVQLVYESGRWEVFDPSDAVEFDGKTGKVNATAPAPGRNSR